MGSSSPLFPLNLSHTYFNKNSWMRPCWARVLKFLLGVSSI
nr:MAG TPA: hypothetical protein [Crassvirales sp.]